MALSGGSQSKGFFNESGMSRDRAAEVAANWRMPFVPEEPYFNDKGGELWRFRCTALLANGRCGNYEDRPDLCKRYEAGSDELCVFGRTLISGPETVLA